MSEEKLFDAEINYLEDKYPVLLKRVRNEAVERFKSRLLSDEVVEAAVEIDYNYEKMERRQTRKDKAELMLKAAIKYAEDTEKKE